MQINTDLEIDAPGTAVWEVVGRRSEMGTWCATVTASLAHQSGTSFRNSRS